jgi:hypothetical protein
MTNPRRRRAPRAVRAVLTPARKSVTRAASFVGRIGNPSYSPDDLLSCRDNRCLRPTTCRPGIVLIVVLAVLAVATLTFVSVARLALAQRQQARVEWWKLQADWLAEAGLERAAATLKLNPAYQGETWKLAPDDLGGPEGGAVVITVEPAPRPDRRTIRAEAVDPDDPIDRARHAKEIVIVLHKGTAP